MEDKKYAYISLYYPQLYRAWGDTPLDAMNEGYLARINSICKQIEARISLQLERDKDFLQALPNVSPDSVTMNHILECMTRIDVWHYVRSVRRTIWFIQHGDY